MLPTGHYPADRIPSQRLGEVEITTSFKGRCQFQGGPGLKEKYRPALPCLGEFEVKPHNAGRSRYCRVCAPFAKKWLSAQNASARYSAEPEKFAKIARENRWERRKAAGRPCLPLGIMVPCRYRDEHRRRGKGCLVKFERKRPAQKFCSVCRKHADADSKRRFRDEHPEEAKKRDAEKSRRYREKLAEAERIVAAAKPKKPLPRGRRKAAEENMSYFKVATATENEISTFTLLFEKKRANHGKTSGLRTAGFNQDQIDAALASQTPTIAARRFISNTYVVDGELLDYDTVAQYHQKFLKFRQS